MRPEGTQAGEGSADYTEHPGIQGWHAEHVFIDAIRPERQIVMYLRAETLQGSPTTPQKLSASARSCKALQSCEDGVKSGFCRPSVVRAAFHRKWCSEADDI